MPDADTSTPIEREIRINARPETVFEFLVDPRKMAQWIGQTVVLQPEPGGLFRVDINSRDIVRGEVVEVEPARRVVFTWGWEHPDSAVPPGSTTVEITLEPAGDATIVRLRHTGLSGEAYEKHAAGWTHYLNRLTTAAADGDPGPDPFGTPDAQHG